jgi:hypothetical protein
MGLFAVQRLVHKKGHLPDVCFVIGHFGLEFGLVVDRTPHLLTWGPGKFREYLLCSPETTIALERHPLFLDTNKDPPGTPDGHPGFFLPS